MFSFRFGRDFHKVLKFNVVNLPSCKISAALSFYGRPLISAAPESLVTK